MLGHTGGVLIPLTKRHLATGSVTPRFGLDYQWTPTFMTYVSAASGYKTGGFNGRANTVDEFTTYRPEKVWTYEAGFRSDLFDRHVRLNGTGFYSDYKDIQVVINGATTSGNDSTLIENAARARITGAEIELTVVPVRGFEINANGGLTDAQYRRLGDGVPFTKADHFSNTPKWSYSIGAQYAFEMVNGSTLTPRIDYNYRSTTYYEALKSLLTTQKGYGLLNARLTYALKQSRASVALFATNLTDKHYFTGAFELYNSLGFAVINPGRPREICVQGEARF